MMRSLLRPFAVLSMLTAVACGSDPPPPPVAPAPEPPPPAPVAATPPPVEPVKAPEPTAEEKKKAEDLKRLQDDRAKMEEAAKAETARWTPEMHAEAKALTEKTFPNGKAAAQAAVAAKFRKPGNAARDKYRHPVETLAFLGVKPSSTVLEIGPGEGWYTEVLAPVVAKQGKLLVTSPDPNGPADSRATLGGQRIQAFLATAPELYGKVQPVIIDGKAPSLNLDGTVDVVLIMRGLHNMHNNGTLKTWLAEINKALKPNGVLGIEEHRAKADGAVDETAKKGYMPEKWVIEQFEQNGFKLAGKSEVNANAKDTKDYPDGVWTLPPSFELKDKDHDKYAAIGESDRMTLKFVKAPAPKTPGTAKPAGAKPATPATPAKPATPATPAKPATPPAKK